MALAIAVIPTLHSSAALYGWTAVLAFSNSIFGPAATGLVSVFADPTEQGTVLRSEEHTSELQSPCNLVCRLLLEKKKKNIYNHLNAITTTPLPNRNHYTFQKSSCSRILQYLDNRVQYDILNSSEKHINISNVMII